MRPRSPELLAPLRQLILARLPDVDVGPKRPANVENLARPFVRINNLGGPWRYVALWYPRLITESWAPTVLEARELDAEVALALADLVGYDGPDFYITQSELDSQGADSTIDGNPVVITQASLVVQVELINE